MGQSISISELAIKVRLDTKGAKEGLRALERKLASLDKKITKTLNSQKSQVLVTKKLAGNAKKVAAAFAKVGKAIKRSLGGLRKMYRATKSIRLEMLSMKSLVLFGGSLLFLNKIWERMKQITKTGAAYSRALNTVGASVRNASYYKGTAEEKAKLVEDNQNFTGNVAYRGGLDATDTAAQYAKIISAADGVMSQNAIQDLFGTTVDFGMVQGLGKEKMKLVMNAMSQMLSKGVISLEELRQQMGEHAPLAMRAFADAITMSGKHGKVTIKELQDLVGTGKVLASETMPHLSAAFKKFVGAEELKKARAELGLIMDQTGTATQFFSTTAVRQYEKPLGKLITRFNELIKGIGFGSAVGRGIRALTLQAAEFLDPIFKQFDEFEKKFAKADNEGKKKLADNFITNTVIPALTSVLQKIKEEVLDPLGQALVDSIKAAIPSWMGGGDTSTMDALSETGDQVFKSLIWDNNDDTNYSPFLSRDLKDESGENTPWFGSSAYWASIGARNRKNSQTTPSNATTNITVHGAENPADDAVKIKNELDITHVSTF